MKLQRLKVWYKRLTCKHERRAKFYPSEEVTWWNTKSGCGGKHNTVLIEGCLNCHKMWMKDFGE
jgi:hypothetical protein